MRIKKGFTKKFLAMVMTLGLVGSMFMMANPKPAAAGTPAEDYLDAVYNLFLGRDANNAEVRHWAPIIDAGHRGRLTHALAVSDEWAGKEVNNLYRTVLGRNADPPGRAHWVRLISNGMRMEEVAINFYSSTEYWNKKDRSSEKFVKSLYENILNRGADPVGMRNWVAKMNQDNGIGGRKSIVRGFYGSIESRTKRVEHLYRVVLNRGVDPAGKKHWSTKLIWMDDIRLAADLAASQEFFNKATKNSTPVSNYVRLRDWETRILNLLNHERTSRGIAPFTLHRCLSDNVAAPWSKYMAERNDFRHNPNWIDQSQACRTQAGGENIVWAHSPETMVHLWMNSEGHRNNILDPRNTIIGIGVYLENVPGNLSAYATTNFARGTF